MLGKPFYLLKNLVIRGLSGAKPNFGPEGSNGGQKCPSPYKNRSKAANLHRHVISHEKFDGGIRF